MVGLLGSPEPPLTDPPPNTHTHFHASALLFLTLPPPAPLHASPAAREDDGAAGWTVGTEAGLGRICLGHRPPRLLRAFFCLRNSTQTNSTSQLLKVRSSLLLFFVKRSSWGRLIANILPPPRLTPPTSIRPTTTTTTHTTPTRLCTSPPFLSTKFNHVDTPQYFRASVLLGYPKPPAHLSQLTCR